MNIQTKLNDISRDMGTVKAAYISLGYENVKLGVKLVSIPGEYLAINLTSGFDIILGFSNHIPWRFIL